MSDVYQMNGSVRVQGRPGVNSEDGKNWCYTYTFIPTLSGDVCDLTILTEDTGATLWPGPLSFNPEINPTSGPAGSVKKGVIVTNGTIETDGAFKPEANEAPYTRGKVNGREQDASESTDRLNIKFDPCLKTGKPFQVKLCMDEELDENDFVTFVPSFHDGSSPQSGDITPSDPLTITEILRLLAGVGSAVAPKLLGRVSNDERRKLIASAVRSDAKLSVTLALGGGDPEATIRGIVSMHGIGLVVDTIRPQALVEALGARSVVDSVSGPSVLRLLGANAIAPALRELGIADEVVRLLNQSEA